MEPTEEQMVAYMDEYEATFDQSMIDVQISMGYAANNPLLVAYKEKGGASYWGFERKMVNCIATSATARAGMYLRYADHSRGFMQLDKPAPLPTGIELFHDPGVPWPMYRVNYTPNLRPDQKGYVPPVETAMRLEIGQPIIQLVRHTYHRQLGVEWQTRRAWRTDRGVLGLVTYSNETSKWMQLNDPRVVEDFSVIGGDLDEFGVRLSHFRSANCSNSIHTNLMDEDEFEVTFESLHIFRPALFEESFEHLMNTLKAHQLRRKLKIKWIGEPSVDDGGPLYDWITVLSDAFIAFKSGDRKLFDVDPFLGIVVSKLAPAVPQLLPFFQFFGRFVGLLLVHGFNLNMELSKPLLKLIKGETLTTRDMAQDESLIRAFKFIMNAKDNRELLNSAIVQAESIVNGLIYNLVSDGHLQAPTMLTRANFIKQKILFHSGGSQSIIDMIRFGINEVMPISWLGYFSVDELGRLLSGTRERIRIGDWIRHTRHDNRLNDPGNPAVIGWFWQIVGIYTIEAQYKLLEFWTGRSQLPMTGISSVHMFTVRIVRGIDLRRMPTVATCSHSLFIPGYATKQILFDKLSETIYGFSGFRYG